MTKKKQAPKKPRRNDAPNRFHELLTEIGQLYDAKNLDYASGGQQGPLGNFDRISALISAYPQSAYWAQPTGIALTYMLKQLDAALMLFTQQKQSAVGEELRSRLLDIACYAIITMQLVEREHETFLVGTQTGLPKMWNAEKWCDYLSHK